MFAADQASKLAILFLLRLPERPCAGGGTGCYDVVPPYLRFRMGWNEGINFGLLSGHPAAVRWLLIALALAVCAWVARWALADGRLWMLLGGGLLVGGAMGNVVDRVAYGAVADFLNMACCGIRNPYSFNIADIGVFAGAILLVLASGPPKTARKTP